MISLTEAHFAHVVGDDQPSRRFTYHLVGADPRGHFAQDKRAVDNLQQGQIGEYPANTAHAGERQGALRQQFDSPFFEAWVITTMMFCAPATSPWRRPSP